MGLEGHFPTMGRRVESVKNLVENTRETVVQTGSGRKDHHRAATDSARLDTRSLTADTNLSHAIPTRRR
jgi:hypothetical protein